MKKLLLIILFCICEVYGQVQIENYDFLSKDEIDSYYSILKIETKNKIKRLSGDFKKEEKIIYKNKIKYLKKNLSDSTYITKKVFNDKISRVLENILNANPDLKKEEPIILLKNTFIPNAASHGLNLIEINLGLFTLVETDDELAFVICHEIAHERMDHFNKKIKKVYNSFYSDENKQKAFLN